MSKNTIAKINEEVKYFLLQLAPVAMAGCMPGEVANYLTRVDRGGLLFA